MKLKGFPHEDPFIVQANIGKNTTFTTGNLVRRILVDGSSSADILVSHTFDQMRINRASLQKSEKPFYGIGGRRIEAQGKITLKVTLALVKAQE